MRWKCRVAIAALVTVSAYAADVRITEPINASRSNTARTRRTCSGRYRPRLNGKRPARLNSSSPSTVTKMAVSANRNGSKWPLRSITSSITIAMKMGSSRTPNGRPSGRKERVLRPALRCSEFRGDRDQVGIELNERRIYGTVLRMALLATVPGSDRLRGGARFFTWV